MKKVFIIDGQITPGWGDNSRSIMGVEIEGQTLKLQKLKGSNLTLEGFLFLLDRISDELDKSNSTFVRVSPYKIKKTTGTSGCMNWQISFLQQKGEFWSEKRKDIVYLSCFGKLLEQQELFIPDLVLILDELISLALPTKDIIIREIEPIDPGSLGYTMP